MTDNDTTTRGEHDPHFVPDDDNENHWPLTPRTRYVMWVALNIIAGELREDIADLKEAGTIDKMDLARQMDLFPAFTYNQPPEWWEQVARAADRMGEAMRTHRDLEPRTPAEEAVVYVAATGEKDVILEIARDDQTSLFARELAQLPEGSDDEGGRGVDYDFDEILDAISGDSDIEMIWDAAMDGLGDPDDEVNREHGIGDYRPQAWHRWFYRAIKDAERAAEDSD